MMNKKNKTNGPFWILILHIAMLVYGSTGFFSKNASFYPFLSLPFILYYAGMILCLGIYAVLWQQVIKHLPVTFSYANKAVTVVWGVVIGHVFFGEHISARQMAACAIIIAGTIWFVLAQAKGEKS